MKAFVSSTFIDLKEHRARVIATLRGGGIHVDPMEDWSASSQEPRTFCLDRLQGCNLCILLVGFRRGFVPEGETLSITQLEYRSAVERGIDVLPFLVEDSTAWPAEYDERRVDPAVEKWRQQLRQDHGVGTFQFDRASLDVGPAVLRWLQERLSENGEPPPRCPAVPRDLADRRQLIEKINTTLAEFGVCVLLGPHGMGKTVLAAVVFSSAGRGQWLECDNWDASQPLPNEGLTVFDSAAPGQDLIIRHALRSFTGRSLITTRHEEVARDILSDLGKADCPDAIVMIPGLEPEEGTRFLDRLVGNELSAGEKSDLIAKLFGCPLALQALPDLIAGRQPFVKIKELLDDRGSLNVDTVAGRVLREWVMGNVQGNASAATRALCRISYVGMSPIVLSHIVCTSTEKLTRWLGGLLDKGYIRRSCHLGDELWIPHDSLRGYFRSQPDDEVDRQHDIRYVEYLSRAIQHGRVAEIGICTRMDAWIAAVRSAFAELRDGDHFEEARDRFLTRLRVNGRLLRGLLGPSLPHTQAARLVSVMEERFKEAECSEVIPAAQCLALLPASAAVAQTAWLGAGHPDGWARASSIWAATHHWLNLSEREQSTGASLLKHWLQKLDLTDESDVDLDIAAALGSLCALGESAWAADFVLSSKSADSCPRGGLSYLAVIVGLLDAGSAQRATAVARRMGRYIPDGDAKELMYEYAAEKRVSLPRSSGPGNVALSQAMTVAAAAHSGGFTRLARKRDKDAFSFISPDLEAKLEFDASDPGTRVGLRGQRLFFGAIGAVLTATIASIALGRWSNPARADWFEWVLLPMGFLVGFALLWRGRQGVLNVLIGGCIGSGIAGLWGVVSTPTLSPLPKGLLAAAYLGAGLVLWRSSSLRGFLVHRKEMATLARSGLARTGK